MSIRRFALGAVAAAVVSTAPLASQAATVQLGFILDSSGSIGAADWGTIVTGLSNAVNSLIPVGGTDVYEVSVVRFASTASAVISNFAVTDVTARSTLASQIAALGFTGGSTNYAAAFQTMQSAFAASTAQDISFSYVNFATDGSPDSNSAGITARDALIASGVDNISIEGIGASSSLATNLQTNYCHPQPCDTTAPFNFPAQGFYIGVASAQEYVTAIGNKISTVTGGGGRVPEPASLALVGLALAGIGLSRRRKQA